MQFENQAAVMMLLLIIVLFYFNDLINGRLTHAPKSSFKTKMNLRINKTNGIFTRIESIANRNYRCNDNSSHLNVFDNLKKMITEKNKFFMSLISVTDEYYLRAISFPHVDEYNIIMYLIVIVCWE